MARRRSHAPPFMRRFQRTFPQPEETPEDPSLREMMDAWEDETPEKSDPEPEVKPPAEDPPKAENKPAPDSVLVDKLMSKSRKQLVKMAKEKNVEIPTRATKRDIATALAGDAEDS